MAVSRSVLVLLIVLAGSCGDDSPKTTTEVDDRKVFVMNDLSGKCDDNGMCVARWTIDGRQYELGCRPDLSGAKGSLYAVAGRNIPKGYEAWTVEGVDPKEALLLPQGTPCLPGSTPRYLVPTQ
jgi:hypothetical protein